LIDAEADPGPLLHVGGQTWHVPGADAIAPRLRRRLDGLDKGRAIRRGGPRRPSRRLDGEQPGEPLSAVRPADAVETEQPKVRDSVDLLRPSADWRIIVALR
jgi:hypothetical protein